MPTDYIRYDLLVQDALRSVVRKVLTDAARTGLPGEHHFNISFKTQAPGVVIPASMRQRYPEEMAIILQHEFWDLAVMADGFEVSLNFSRKPERLTIPFDSITGFSDPSVPFGFKLEPRAEVEATTPGPVRREPTPQTRRESLPQPKREPQLPQARREPAPPSETKPTTPRAVPTVLPRVVETGKVPKNAAEKSTEGDPAKVVSIDAFRKK
jgi:hypothetical protein